MFEALQHRDNPYHSNELSLKRQTIREDGAQSHGPDRATNDAVANRTDSPMDSLEFARQPGCQLRRRM